MNCLNACSFLPSDRLFSFVSENVDKGPICTIELDGQKVQQFIDAIESSYWFELFIGMMIRISLLIFALLHICFLVSDGTSCSDILCMELSSFACRAKSPR